MNGATVPWREGVSPSVACRKARLFPSAHFQKETRLAARLEGETPSLRRPLQVQQTARGAWNVRSALLACIVLGVGCTPESETPDVDWPVYLGDSGRAHYSELGQINRDNVASLELAWVYDSGEPSGTMYTSPLVIDGVFYGLSPKLVPFALNAATGEEIWRNETLDLPGAAQRGLMWWERGSDQRILFAAGRELIALNADDGQLVPSFGDGGRLDMRPKENDRGGHFGYTAPGVVFEDKIITGFTTAEWADAFPGSIRAFSAVDGELVWQFNTIPAPGERGSETWAEGSLEKAGGANAWTAMTLDEERGLLFVPTGSATPDFYGAPRLGDNLYANSIVALDARTGEYRWHYQMMRHDLWDRDNPSPPTLVQLERDGRVIDAVTLTTKSGHLFVFDRETGESLHPIFEADTAMESSMPGEVTAAKQPISSIAFSRQTFEVTNRTPEAHQAVLEKIKDYDIRPWAPPKVGTILLFPWYDGGAEWGGSAFDPATNRLILNANDVAGPLTLSEIPVGFSKAASYAQHCGSCHAPDFSGTDAGPSLVGVVERVGYSETLAIINEGKGRMAAFAHLEEHVRTGIVQHLMQPEPLIDEPTTEVTYAHCCYVYLRDHEDLPGNTPPWGTLNSIDLATGEIVWQVPFGNFPTHPDLGFGAVNYGGPVVTKSGLIFIGATPDRKFRAHDTRDGSILWETELTAAAFSTPAVYSVAGKQYVSIAAGGGRMGPPSGSEYFTFTLPD